MPETPLYTRLVEHKNKDHSSFHTPGHKCSDFFPQDLLKLDLTELPDTDALYEADGVIRSAEIKLAELFGAKHTLISSGGCTLAIQTMLRLACEKGKKIIFARNSHRSAVHACALLGIEPLWVMPYSENALFSGRIRPEDVEALLEKNRDVSACYITSPDYYGELSDIKAIADVCHSHGALLLADNAHGSHLAFMENDLHPLHLGADMSACSLHKTLPVLTGGAVLNINADISLEEAKNAMSLFGSTSPSYPIMASIDLCRSYLQNGGSEKYRRLEKRVRLLKELASRQGLIQPEGLCDPIRLCINTSCAGIIVGEQTEFFHSYNIEPEFCDGENAVFIITPFNSERDLMRLETALTSIKGRSIKAVPDLNRLPEYVISPRTALFSKTEDVPVERSAGRISADTACPCPPGVPVIMPGERIDDAVVRSLKKDGKQSIRCAVL